MANRELLEKVQRIDLESGGAYGSPRIHAVLRRTGQHVGRSRVETLMQRAGLRGLAAVPRRVRTTDSRHNYPIAPNRLARNFTAQRPNQIWLADLTYLPPGEGWLYLAAILDACTSKIVGWSMRDTLHPEIALDALAMALPRQRPGPGLLHHADRGIQYAAEAYPQTLTTAKITPSISRKGNCWDNAPMESFFHTLKIECVPHRVYATKDQARRHLFAYIERFYNSHRLHSALGYRSPAEMERTAALPLHFFGGRALVLTGLRVSEIIGLQWQDVDLAGETLCLRRGVVNQEVTALKTAGSARLLPLPKAVIEALVRWKQVAFFSALEDWVFASPHSGGRQPYWPGTLLQKVLQPTARELGITKRVGWHTFRRSFATLLHASGASVKTTQELMRHSTPNVTLGVYAQAVSSEKRNAQAHIAGLILDPKRESLEVSA